MADAARRYSFQPLERRGVLLGLQAGQLLTIGGGVLVAIAFGRLIGGSLGTAAAMAVAIGSFAGSVWPSRGRPVLHWAPVWAAWRWRRASGPDLGADPLAGSSTMPALRPPRMMAGVQVQGTYVVDRRHATLLAVVPVRGRAFSLMDPEEQAGRLDAWRTVLTAVARPGSPVRRVQWVETCAPDSTSSASVAAGAGRIGAAAESYGHLVASSPPARMHQAWVVLAVPNRGSAAREALSREMRLLDGQLRNADLHPGPPMAGEELATVLARPLAACDDWAWWRADDLFHATYWVAEWPRLEVPPDFLTPLLLCGGRRRVAVVMAPVPTDRAVREARSSRTADLADAEIRARAGFLSSARRELEAEGAVRREQELAEGHTEYRFSGYVTVTAAGLDELARSCAEVEHAAQAAHLELRRLYGRQGEAYGWTLPLARGLAP